MILKISAILFLLVLKSLYVPLNRRASRYYWQKKIDFFIPLIALFVFPYIAYYPFIILSFLLLWNSTFFMSFTISMIVSYVIAELIWYFFPNGVKRPVFEDVTFAKKILNFIYSHDNDTNGFPSAHVFVSLLCGYFLYLQFPSALLAIVVTTLLIAISTVFTKQHYAIDVLGGFGVVLLSLFLTNYFGYPVW